MKKSDREIYLLDISQTEYKSDRPSKIKTTDINILLNRVKKKNNFYKFVVVRCGFNGSFYFYLA